MVLVDIGEGRGCGTETHQGQQWWQQLVIKSMIVAVLLELPMSDISRLSGRALMQRHLGVCSKNTRLLFVGEQMRDEQLRDGEVTAEIGTTTPTIGKDLIFSVDGEILKEERGLDELRQQHLGGWSMARLSKELEVETLGMRDGGTEGEQGGALMFLCNGICTWRLPTSIMEMWSQRCLGNETHGEDGTSVRTPGDSGGTANGTPHCGEQRQQQDDVVDDAPVEEDGERWRGKERKGSVKGVGGGGIAFMENALLFWRRCRREYEGQGGFWPAAGQRKKKGR
uniref:Uncharacterized protein n=1 Tax=Oryza sativa subsp. japonica TaxID=39947 RepID=Q6YTA7_ORYSJ|nr:hypothetical protein [Oryza sativa Japonica Group]